MPSSFLRGESLQKASFPFAQLTVLFFFRHRIPIHQWWIQLRPLLRIMAHYSDDTAVYETDVDLDSRS